MRTLTVKYALPLLLAGLVTAAPALAAAPDAAAPAPGQQQPASQEKKVFPRPRSTANVYENQPDFTEEELLRFIRHLPDFRSWMHQHNEKAYPVVKKGKPDFYYSPAAAEWVEFRSWDARRFFCIMGRSAAALVLVSEGEQAKKLYRDMPKPSKAECELVSKHMGELLKAGNDVVQDAGKVGK